MVKDLIVGNARVMVSDDVADALLDLALALGSRGQTDVATFPARVDGRDAETRMLVGAGLAMTVVGVDFDLPAEIEGADFAAWNLRRRLAVLAGDVTDVDWTGGDQSG